jgi:hypothetical protein
MLTNRRLRLAAMTGLFLLAMLGLRQVAHASVAAGPFAWLALMGAIFAVGITLENRRRVAEGRPFYSAAEARELAVPLGALGAVLALAYCFS